jgi:hypothetical protein
VRTKKIYKFVYGLNKISSLPRSLYILHEANLNLDYESSISKYHHYLGPYAFFGSKFEKGEGERKDSRVLHLGTISIGSIYVGRCYLMELSLDVAI